MTKSSPLSSLVNRLPNANIELTLTIPWGEIQKAYEKVVLEAVAETELPGFRKGKAPKKLVEAKLDKTQTLNHALQHLLPKAYTDATNKYALKPVLYPQIKVISGKEEEDWVFLATTCEAPKVKLGPLSRDLEQLVKTSEVHMADLLIEEEAHHRLASLAENITQLGLSIDTYLKTKRLTAESLKGQLAQDARHDLAIEFVLQEVQRTQKLEGRPQTLEYLQKLV